MTALKIETGRACAQRVALKNELQTRGTAGVWIMGYEALSPHYVSVHLDCNSNECHPKETH